ncbi:MAG: hypothetical protein M3173_05350 [Chloroflexota bacterium]|nr:hypothetical protein [Chloroflexota bacterium]
MTDKQAPIACRVPAYDDGAPPKQPALMLAFRFLLELVAFRRSAWRIGGGGVPGVGLAVVMTIATMSLWAC